MKLKPDILTENNKFNIQDKRYEYPYHYIPNIDNEGYVSRMRFWAWGYEYFCNLLNVKAIIDELSPTSILDAGCGDGRLLGLLEGKINQMVGVDLSEKAIRFARIFNKNVEFKLCDIHDVPGEFDVVTAVEVLEHIPDQTIPHFTKGLESKVKMGGHLIITVPSKLRRVIPKHYRHYDLNLLQDQVLSNTKHMKLEKSQYIYKKTFMIKAWLKITNNRFWTLEFHLVRGQIWKWIWRNLRYANPDNGYHIVAVFKKV